MPGLVDALSASIRSHTGLHYVPSFNDFVSSANDDVEAMEALAQQQHDMDLAPRDQAARAGAPAAAKTSNKADDLPGLTSAVAMDIHKVNRFSSDHAASTFIDNARGGRNAPSVWQYILHSQGKERLPSFAELAGTSPSGSGLPAGAALSAATQAAAATMKHGQQQHTQQAAQGKTIGAAELQKHFNVSQAQAEAMVAEADRDNDKRISSQEWEDIINEVSA
ncbi:hypothetical protein CHLRE_06g271900v5 [Chlamydomonas reinhardtii]|uniref:EF-hand domain-containing protein n=1 Tax=Chlamydomonas reinhardtii TaxID=3055 RepID=A8HVV6_CHLRE|nr:uncharacterized protein CHLRE_06g271900v5 [Chlamydomonas reinhardtii]XP_042923662.1 uncharacterized protein CHLRE_06g271900v5 [Chlamydomonas reinhardtii]PNW82056.1 hypothetical protein CHLRE_06g271900v5 [Chlamydomonas reinhardtii]PNW82057.1 hypothetical protein CHLRE_06g271900v5 [Chlamydomonas reinhardtii]|eukprot:XP_001696483.1 predicted protein [Chlamydomonas reinhardtii]